MHCDQLPCGRPRPWLAPTPAAVARAPAALQRAPPATGGARLRQAMGLCLAGSMQSWHAPSSAVRRALLACTCAVISGTHRHDHMSTPYTQLRRRWHCHFKRMRITPGAGNATQQSAPPPHPADGAARSSMWPSACTQHCAVAMCWCASNIGAEIAAPASSKRRCACA